MTAGLASREAGAGPEVADDRVQVGVRLDETLQVGERQLPVWSGAAPPRLPGRPRSNRDLERRQLRAVSADAGTKKPPPRNGPGLPSRRGSAVSSRSRPARSLDVAARVVALESVRLALGERDDAVGVGIIICA